MEESVGCAGGRKDLADLNGCLTPPLGAGGGNVQNLAGVDQVGILNLRICLRDAAPGETAAEVILRQLPHRIAALDADRSGAFGLRPDPMR